ncbi:MAG TPA: hypothetical protein VFP51_12700, partial [Nocardioidaceae bacterium]|nr:hypothetical protein [Nocardioidaceae bacterium]
EGRRVGRVLVTTVPPVVMVNPDHPISIEPGSAASASTPSASTPSGSTTSESATSDDTSDDGEPARAE